MYNQIKEDSEASVTVLRGELYLHRIPVVALCAT